MTNFVCFNSSNKFLEMRKLIFHLVGIGMLSLALLSCSGEEEEVVNIYTHRHYAADQELFARFTAQTGIKVNVVNASADELIQKSEWKGAIRPADILMTVDDGRLHRAEEKGLFQKCETEVIERNIPAKFRDAESYWTGLRSRARVIDYSKDRVNPE